MNTDSSDKSFIQRYWWIISHSDISIWRVLITKKNHPQNYFNFYNINDHLTSEIGSIIGVFTLLLVIYNISQWYDCTISYWFMNVWMFFINFFYHIRSLSNFTLFFRNKFWIISQHYSPSHNISRIEGAKNTILIYIEKTVMLSIIKKF